LAKVDKAATIHIYTDNNHPLVLNPQHATQKMLRILSQLAVLSLVGLSFLGAFSRFTHGKYTPSFYAYQLDRAPDNEYTWVIPVFDVLVGTCLVFRKTRGWTMLFIVLAQGGGLVSRVLEGKDFTKDLGILATVVGVIFIERRGRGRL